MHRSHYAPTPDVLVSQTVSPPPPPGRAPTRTTTHNYTPRLLALARARQHTLDLEHTRIGIRVIKQRRSHVSPPLSLSFLFSPASFPLPPSRCSRGSEASRLFRPDANALVKTDDDNVREEEGRGGKLARDGHSEITLDRSLSLTWP